MSHPNKNNHIVMLNKAYPPWIGGIERHVQDISEALVKRGWRVTALVCNDTYEKKEEMINGVQVIRLPRLTTILSQPIVAGYFTKLKSLQPDIIHVHAPFPLGWFARNRVSKKTPIVCTWHSDIVRQTFLRPLYGRFEQRFLERCDKIFPTSLPLQKNSYALRSVQDKCFVIPLALPQTTIDQNHVPQVEEIKKRYPGFIILFVGRLVGYKGLPFLIDAMKNIDAHLLIIGDGPMKSELQEQANNISSKIHFLGYQSEEDKNAYYQAADLFVLPSIAPSEAFGYVLLEAMQQGCPLLTTDLPTGVTYVNQHEKTGLVVPQKNAQALHDAILQIMNNESLRQTFAVNAKQRVDEVFSFKASIDQLEKQYKDVLEHT